MSNYVTPRSVSKLEAEIAELEKEWEANQAPEDEEQETEEEVEHDTSPPVRPEPEPEDEEEKSWKKRHGDERRRNQKLADDLKAAQEAIKRLEKQQTSPGLPTAEEAEQWAKANPKAAAIIRGLVADEVSTSKSELAEIKTQLARSQQQAEILKAHPDFKQITHVDNAAFHDWAEAQPLFVQDRIYGADNTAEDVIWAITQYKEKTAEKPNLKKEAAKAVASKSSVDVGTPTKGRFSESQVSKMSMSEYEKNADAIAEAMRSGTFVYDLTGAAR